MMGTLRFFTHEKLSLTHKGKPGSEIPIGKTISHKSGEQWLSDNFGVSFTNIHKKSDQIIQGELKLENTNYNLYLHFD